MVMQFWFMSTSTLNESSRAVGTAKNTGRGHREGEVRDRSQVYNPVTRTWTKRDSDTGEFMDGKEGGKPFKGVRKEH